MHAWDKWFVKPQFYQSLLNYFSAFDCPTFVLGWIERSWEYPMRFLCWDWRGKIFSPHSTYFWTRENWKSWYLCICISPNGVSLGFANCLVKQRKKQVQLHDSATTASWKMKEFALFWVHLPLPFFRKYKIFENNFKIYTFFEEFQKYCQISKVYSKRM